MSDKTHPETDSPEPSTSSQTASNDSPNDSATASNDSDPETSESRHSSGAVYRGDRIDDPPPPKPHVPIPYEDGGVTQYFGDLEPSRPEA